jgi:hypothetical protein
LPGREKIYNFINTDLQRKENCNKKNGRFESELSSTRTRCNQKENLQLIEEPHRRSQLLKLYPLGFSISWKKPLLYLQRFDL